MKKIDDLRREAGVAVSQETLTAPELHRLTGVPLNRVIEELAGAAVARTLVRCTIPTTRERRRSLRVTVYPSVSLREVLDERGYLTGGFRGMPAMMSVREALQALGIEPTPRRVESLKDALDRRGVPSMQDRRDVVDRLPDREMEVFVYDKRVALLALAAAHEASYKSPTALRTLVTAGHMLSSLRYTERNPRLNWSISASEAFDTQQRELLIAPWLLGFWLGDGDHDNYQITVGDEDHDAIVPMIERAWGGAARVRNLQGKCKVSLRRPDPSACVQGHPIVGTGACRECLRLYEYKGLHRPRPGINAPFRERLRHIGVFKNKHIPAPYLRASRGQRLALLQGLIDSDGHVTRRGSAQLGFSDARLASDALELIRSLGIRASVTTGPTHRTTPTGERIPGKEGHRIHFTTNRPVASLRRKADRLLEAGAEVNRRRIFVESVELAAEEAELIALTIDDPSHSLLVEEFLPVVDAWGVRD